MACKVAVKQVKAVLMDPKIMLMVFGIPFLFRFLVPGFDGPAFPAVMMAYVLLGLQSMGADGLSTLTGVTQFPVKVRDHVTGLFLFQALCVLVTAALAALFMRVFAADQLMADVIYKSLAMGLLLSGVITVLALWLRPQVARVINMMLVMFAMTFIISNNRAGQVFLPWVSVPAALLIGAAGWGILLVLALRFPPRVG